MAAVVAAAVAVAAAAARQVAATERQSKRATRSLPPAARAICVHMGRGEGTRVALGERVAVWWRVDVR